MIFERVMTDCELAAGCLNLRRIGERDGLQEDTALSICASNSRRPIKLIAVSWKVFPVPNPPTGRQVFFHQRNVFPIECSADLFLQACLGAVASRTNEGLYRTAVVKGANRVFL